MYIFAKLGKYEFIFARFFGAGLCNILFPWARSVVAAKKFGFSLIQPTWLNIRVGSIIRKENDLRFYGDLFYNPNKNICGIKKLLVLFFSTKTNERYIGSGLRNKNTVVVFTGIDGFFQPILTDYIFVRDQLIKMTYPKHLLGLSYDFTNSISLHVRLGDFKVGKQVTSINWFVNVVNLLRERSKTYLNVYIFTDGNNDEIAPLLELDNAKRMSFGSSIADLLALSKSHILIGSKGSTFSMWASYLGRMPVIWPEGGLVQKLYVNMEELEVESNGFSLPSSFPI